MDFTDALLRLFGIVTRWNTHARGFGLLLALPLIIVGVTDWRIRGRR